MQTFPWSDLYHIALYWGPREEDIHSSARRLTHHLAKLEPLRSAVNGSRSVYGLKRPLFPLPERSEEYAPMFEVTGEERDAGQVACVLAVTVFKPARSR